MFNLQHQFNNIVKTTKLTNDQMTSHCHCECLKCSPPAPSSNTSLQSLTLISLSQSCQSIFVAGCPDNLKRFLDFGDCFRLCFKFVVSFQHCTPHVIVHWVYIRRIWKPLVLCDEIWTVGPQQSVCCALCMLARRPAGGWIRWTVGDCLETII